jgi:hypothetical protein
MEQKKVKKEWKTPELIVLVRSKPEENVLKSCKNSTVPTVGPNNVNGICDTQNGPNTGPCHTYALS